MYLSDWVFLGWLSVKKLFFMEDVKVMCYTTSPGSTNAKPVDLQRLRMGREGGGIE